MNFGNSRRCQQAWDYRSILAALPGNLQVCCADDTAGRAARFFCASVMSVFVIGDVNYVLKISTSLGPPGTCGQLGNITFFEYVFMSCRSIMLKKMHLAVQDARSGCTERNRGHSGFSRTIWMCEIMCCFSFIKVYWPSRIHLDLPPFKPAISLRHSTWPRPRVCRCQNCSGSMWYSNSTLEPLLLAVDEKTAEL